MQEASEQASYTQGTMLAPVKVDALDPDKPVCCICLQPFGSTTLTQGGSEAPTQLPCGHVFGEACMASWARVNNSCPLCRKQAFSFGIEDHSASQHSSNFQVSNPLSPVFSPQDDMWLDENIWNDSGSSRQHRVSFIDIETLIYVYTHNHLDVDLGSEYQRSLETLSCGEHRGFCQCKVDQNTRNAALPHRRLTTAATTATEPPKINMFDLVQLGSQFAELAYWHELWMDNFLNEPCFGEHNPVLDGTAEDFSQWIHSQDSAKLSATTAIEQ
ncbi:hypothetical protein SVAN01_08615 [Stagonosporopsis vannaccii]|nr:hypothetical protein SVAN01_08615 [Stagonosporopsis vannaccii]